MCLDLISVEIADITWKLCRQFLKPQRRLGDHPFVWLPGDGPGDDSDKEEEMWRLFHDGTEGTVQEETNITAVKYFSE